MSTYPPYQQPAPVMQPMPAYPVQQPMTVVKRPIFSGGLVLALVLVGIILFYVGMMLLTSSAFIKEPNDYDKYEKYKEDVKDTVATGRVVLEAGGLIACIGFFGGAINNNELDIKIRVIFVSSAIAFIIAVMVTLNIFAGY